MDYRYKVEGQVEKAFILRCMHFRVGGEINTVILEGELGFVKEHCNLNKIEDLSVASQPMPSDSKTTMKGEKNELPKQPSNSATNKGKIATKISVPKS